MISLVDVLIFLCASCLCREDSTRFCKNFKKEVDEPLPPVLYYDSRADESREALKRALQLGMAQDVP